MTKSELLHRWDDFWFARVHPHAQALLRIAFALYLLIEAATYLPHVSAMFSDRALTFSMLSPSAALWLRPLLDPPSVTAAWMIASVYVAACLGLLLGWGMRFWLIVLLVLDVYYFQLSFFLFRSSYHRIYFVLQLLFLLSGADRTFSLRMLRMHGSLFAWEYISVFPQRILAVQMTVTYLGVGLQKSWLPDWQDGSALTASLLHRWGTPVGRWVVGLNWPFWVWSGAVESVKIFEFFLPVCLWLKAWRPYAVIGGLLFHGGIAVLMSIWWFLPLVPAYIVFWPPEDVYAFCRRRFPERID
jgi:hypothetical protein